jgi:hypothetical protein
MVKLEITESAHLAVAVAEELIQIPLVVLVETES